MDDPRFVRSLEGGADLNRQIDRLFHWQGPLVDAILEGGTGAVGHGDEELPVIGLADIEHGTDVRVIEGGGGAGLA